MLSYIVSALVFLLTLGGFWLGVRLSSLLPERQVHGRPARDHATSTDHSDNGAEK